jgi:hypothetical protein
VDSDGGAVPRTRGTATGVKGAFTDECNDEGNLVEYSCEVVTVAPPMCSGTPTASGAAAPIPLCRIITGEVLATTIPCEGGCTEGTCYAWCPDFQDQLTYAEVESGHVVLENKAEGHRFECVTTDQADLADCEAPALVGTIAELSALGTCNFAGVVLGVDIEKNPSSPDCYYNCVLVQ